MLAVPALEVVLKLSALSSKASAKRFFNATGRGAALHRGLRARPVALPSQQGSNQAGTAQVTRIRAADFDGGGRQENGYCRSIGAARSTRA